jgi:hypothetical protein
MEMDIEQAKAIVEKISPNCVWVTTSLFKGEPDQWEAFNYTFDSETLVRLFYFDAATMMITDVEGSIVAA